MTYGETPVHCYCKGRCTLGLGLSPSGISSIQVLTVSTRKKSWKKGRRRTDGIWFKFLESNKMPLRTVVFFFFLGGAATFIIHSFCFHRTSSMVFSINLLFLILYCYIDEYQPTSCITNFSLDIKIISNKTVSSTCIAWFASKTWKVWVQVPKMSIKNFKPSFPTPVKVPEDEAAPVCHTTLHY